MIGIWFVGLVVFGIPTLLIISVIVPKTGKYCSEHDRHYTAFWEPGYNYSDTGIQTVGLVNSIAQTKWGKKNIGDRKIHFYEA